MEECRLKVKSILINNFYIFALTTIISIAKLSAFRVF
ncbi:hypothetical protein SPACI_011640 [Sporomusa acidovorans DSM 3132]|uniref:Uncharacterized protein n=1 Tax=Sporomusa acidovorans (strain ATCC 49682 / DSM 3132 / Mol) TaxID=1123286 RepID=A0ABZ3IYH3_SPOA4|nr:hypothetical protein SPACI_38780 [Sporomusa acidovorans DSM 3132]SDF15197.1 hypothetical protein SAMN04488499_103511 [Sporomusa acidovorans]